MIVSRCSLNPLPMLSSLTPSFANGKAQNISYILEEPIEFVLSPEASGIALTGAIDIFAFGKAQNMT